MIKQVMVRRGDLHHGEIFVMIRVEFIDGMEWVIYSRPKHEETARIHAEVIHVSRKTAVRVVKDGEIIFQLPLP